MRAITVLQPWASLLAHGIKTWETRSWRLPAKYIYDPARPSRENEETAIVIHAGKSRRGLANMSPDVLVELGLPAHHVERLPFGAAIATARIWECAQIKTILIHRDGRMSVQAMNRWRSCTHIGISDVEKRLGKFAEGRWMWKVGSVELLEEPVPCRGYQRLWRVPGEVADAIDQIPF